MYFGINAIYFLRTGESEGFFENDFKEKIIEKIKKYFMNGKEFNIWGMIRYAGCILQSWYLTNIY